MKWIFPIIGAFVVVIGLTAGIGTLLPKEHIATRTARFSTPPERLWRTITDIERYPVWRKELSSVEILPDLNGHRAWRENGEFGSVTMEQTEAVELKRMVGRMADTDQPFGGRWIYEIEPNEGGSTLTITEEGEVYNPVFRFLSNFVFGHTATMDGYIMALADHYGEKVEIR